MRLKHANGYRRYTWVGNRITREAMAGLYSLKKQQGRPITHLVAEAIEGYLSMQLKDNNREGTKGI